MDLYQTLGVRKDASPEEIRREYRKAARRTHPDRGGKVEDFQAVEFAWRILGDQQKRLRYDSLGETVETPDPLTVARQELVALILSKAETGLDVWEEVLMHIRGVQGQLSARRLQTQASIGKLERQRKRFKYKGSGDDRVDGAFEFALAGKKEMLKQLDAADEQGRIMLELLGEYDYERPTEEAAVTGPVVTRAGWTRIS